MALGPEEAPQMYVITVETWLLCSFLDVIDDHALSFMLTNQPVHEKKHFDLFFDVRMPLKLDMVVDLLRPKEFNSHMGKMAVPEYDHILANHVLPMLNLKSKL